MLYLWVIIIIIIIIIVIIIGSLTHVLTVVIAVISFVSRVIIKDQRLTEWSILYISNPFFNILPVPKIAVFCITPALFVIPNFSNDLSSDLWLFQELQSLQARHLLFWVSIMLQLFSLSPDTIPLSLLLFSLPLHQLVQQYVWLYSFALFVN